jgi:hypothetical protein
VVSTINSKKGEGKMTKDKKMLMNTQDLLNEAKKVYYIQYKSLKDLEIQVEERKAEIERLGGFLKSLGIDPDSVLTKKVRQADRIRKARQKK